MVGVSPGYSPTRLPVIADVKRLLFFVAHLGSLVFVLGPATPTLTWIPAHT